jgi:hypothetical protein
MGDRLGRQIGELTAVAGRRGEAEEYVIDAGALDGGEAICDHLWAGPARRWRSSQELWIGLALDVPIVRPRSRHRPGVWCYTRGLGSLSVLGPRSVPASPGRSPIRVGGVAGLAVRYPG